MSLFDSSAILNLYFEGRYSLFMDASTTSLARYGLGDAVWRKVRLLKEINLEEGRTLLQALNSLCEKMSLATDHSPEEALRIAVEEGISFYDATYVSAAQASSLPLVTDDVQLLKSARKYVTTMRSSDLAKQ